jgi:hypothetical protein
MMPAHHSFPVLARISGGTIKPRRHGGFDCAPEKERRQFQLILSELCTGITGTRAELTTSAYLDGNKFGSGKGAVWE